MQTLISTLFAHGLTVYHVKRVRQSLRDRHEGDDMATTIAGLCIVMGIHPAHVWDQAIPADYGPLILERFHALHESTLLTVEDYEVPSYATADILGPQDTLHLPFGDHPLPKRIRETWDVNGPLWLFTRGNANLMKSRYTVGIVGTRKASHDAQLIAFGIAQSLSARGVTVISGMAVGIDQAAHRGAIAGGGPTIGVVASGLDHDYPTNSAPLRHTLLQNGLLVAEYPRSTPITNKGQFLDRNRIIAALSNIVVVVEASGRSGAINTAQWAGQMGKDVAAVPFSPTGAGAAGSNKLLQDGAICVTNAQDILDILHLKPNQFAADTLAPIDQELHSLHAMIATLDANAQTVLSLLSGTPITMGALRESAQLPMGVLMASLGKLQIMGVAHISNRGITSTLPPLQRPNVQ